MRAVLADALGCFQKVVVRQGRRVQRFTGAEFALHHIANVHALRHTGRAVGKSVLYVGSPQNSLQWVQFRQGGKGSRGVKR